MSNIAEAAQMSVGNVYRYFVGKEDILVTLGKEGVGGMTAPSMTTIASWIAATVEMSENREFAALTIELTAEARRNGELKTVYRNNKRHHVAALAQTIKTAQHAGEVREDADPETLAQFLVCLNEGFCNRSAFGEDVAGARMIDLLWRLLSPK